MKRSRTEAGLGQGDGLRPQHAGVSHNLAACYSWQVRAQMSRLRHLVAYFRKDCLDVLSPVVVPKRACKSSVHRSAGGAITKGELLAWLHLNPYFRLRQPEVPLALLASACSSSELQEGSRSPFVRSASAPSSLQESARAGDPGLPNLSQARPRGFFGPRKVLLSSCFPAAHNFCTHASLCFLLYARVWTAVSRRPLAPVLHAPTEAAALVSCRCSCPVAALDDISLSLEFP